MDSINDFDRNKADKVLKAIKDGEGMNGILSLSGLTELTLETWLDIGSNKDAPAELQIFHKQFLTVVGEEAKGTYGIISRRAAKAAKNIGYVYFIRENALGKLKIGYTEDNPNKRVSVLQTSCPQELKLIAIIESEHAIKLESKIHKECSDKRHRLEWFTISDKELADILKRHGGRYIEDTIWHDPQS